MKAATSGSLLLSFAAADDVSALTKQNEKSTNITHTYNEFERFFLFDRENEDKYVHQQQRTNEKRKEKSQWNSFEKKKKKIKTRGLLPLCA